MMDITNKLKALMRAFRIYMEEQYVDEANTVIAETLIEITDLRAQLASQKEHVNTVDEPNLNKAIKALGDLSFECFDVLSTRAPSLEVYNRTFKVLEELRQAQLTNAKPSTNSDEIAGWIKDGDTIPVEIIEVARLAICKEFGNNGTAGYYKRILVKIFAAISERG